MLNKKSIKLVRKELRAWGKYWHYQEQGQGFAGRSACDKLGEVLTGNAVFVEHSAPSHILAYDADIERLTPNCRRALRACYICNRNWALIGFDSQRSYEFWLRKAEGALL